MTVDPYFPETKAARSRIAVRVSGEFAVTEAELSLMAVLLDEIVLENPVLQKKLPRDSSFETTEPERNGERGG